MITFRDIDHREINRNWCLIILAMLCGTVCFTAVTSLIIVSTTNTNPPNLLGLILTAVISLVCSIIFCVLKYILDNPETFTSGACATSTFGRCKCCLRELVYTNVSDEEDEESEFKFENK
jgi:hypothetical protein